MAKDKKCEISVSTRHIIEVGDHYRQISKVILFKKTLFSWFTHILFSILTAGIGLLFLYWFPAALIRIKYEYANDINDATCVLIFSEDKKRKDIEQLHRVSVSQNELDLATGYIDFFSLEDCQALQQNKRVDTCLFQHFASRYVYCPTTRLFEFIRLDFEMSVEHFYRYFGPGISSKEIIDERRELYGPGCIDIPIPSILRLLFTELLHPLYIFQLYSLALWYSDQYYAYASSVLFITSFSLIAEVHEMRRNAKRLRKLASFDALQRVLVTSQLAMELELTHIPADNKMKTKSLDQKINSLYPDQVVLLGPNDLVPGNIVELSRGTLPCDMILLEGSVLMNESMINGEAVPKLKSAVSSYSDTYTITSRIARSHYQGLSYVLYGGTEVVQIKGLQGEKPKAVVIRTGYSTAQGHTLSVLLEPVEHHTDAFIRETYKLLCALFVLACFGSLLILFVTLPYHLHSSVVILRCMDIFTNVIPPALPATMAVSIGFAITRLKRYRKVICIQASSVNIAGLANTMIFDKTGTLTYDQLTIEHVMTTDLIANKSSVTQAGLSVKKGLFQFPESSDVSTNSTDTVGPSSDSCKQAVLKSSESHYLAELATPSVLSTSGQRTLDQEEELIWKDQCNNTLLDLAEIQLNNSNTVINSYVHQEEEQLKLVKLPKTFDQSKKELPEFCISAASATDLPLSFAGAIASCHSLSYWNNTIIGDTMEIQLLEFVKWRFFEYHQERFTPDGIPYAMDVMYPEESSNQLCIIKRFEFTPEAQRMSVIVYDRKNSNYIVICKGSPEQLEQRCRKSTLPRDYIARLRQNTQQGKRVISYGIKKISLSMLGKLSGEDSRNMVEDNLIFIGFVVFSNELKPDSARVIRDMKAAGVRCVISTGDNALTTISVAKKCHFFDDYNNMESSKPPVETIIFLGQVIKQGSNESGSDRDSQSEAAKSNSIGGQSTSEIYRSYNLIWKPVILNSGESQSKNEIEEVTTSIDYISSDLTIDGQKQLSHNAHQYTFFNTVKPSKENKYHEGFENFSNTFKLNSKISQESLQTDDMRTAASTPISAGFDANYIKNHHFNFEDPRLNYFAQKINKNQGLTSKQLIELLSETPESLTNTRIMVALTGMAMRLLHVSCNSTDEYNIQLPMHQHIVPPQNKSNEKGWFSFFSKKTEKMSHHEKTRDTACDYKELIKSDFYNQAMHGSQDFQKNPLSNEDINSKQISLFEYCLRTCRVFARMTPQDKAQLVRYIQELDGHPAVGMCGDGANDCEALKMADVGVSLSGQVTSISATMASLTQSVQSAMDVLSEGRGTLVNAFQNAKFIICYAILQFSATLILFFFGNNYTDNEYMVVDIFLVLTLATTCAWTRSADKLTADTPTTHLTGWSVMLSILGQAIIFNVFMMLALMLLINMSFYTRFIPSEDAYRFENDDLRCFENTTIFLVSACQYVILNIVLTNGKPWRKSRLSNYYYVVNLIAVIALCISFFLSQEFFPGLASFLGLQEISLSFRGMLAVIVLMDLIVAYCYEKYVVSLITKYEMKKYAGTTFIDHPSHFN